MAQTIKNNTEQAQTAGSARAEELSVRVEAAGRGGVPLRTVFPAGVLSDLGKGELPIETDLKLRLPGLGWRVAPVSILPPNAGTAAPEGTRTVGLRVPGHDETPLRLAFRGRTRAA